MNANRYTAAMNLVAGALLAAMLQGCASDGGGNGNGVSQAVYDALNAEVAAALKTTTAARAEAAAARPAAAAAQAEAEAARSAAAAARLKAAAAKSAEAKAIAAAATAQAAAAEARAAGTAALAAAAAAKSAAATARTAETAARTAETAAKTAAAEAKEARTKAAADTAAAETAAEAARAAEQAARTAAALATSEAEAARAAETQAKAAEQAARLAETQAKADEQAAKTAEATAKAESATAKKQLEELLNVPKAGTLAGSAGRAEAARLADAVAQAGGGAFLAHHINALGGSAAYSGTASGQLAVRAQGDYLVRYGRFTATATMTADFDVAESTTMPGVRFPTAHIHDFRDASGSVLEGWLVNLHGPAAFAGNRLSGATSGITGSLAWTGVWLGSLYGGTTTGAYPTSVAGGFQADAGTPLPVTTPEGRIDLFRDKGFAGVLGSFRACRPAGPACRF